MPEVAMTSIEGRCEANKEKIRLVIFSPSEISPGMRRNKTLQKISVVDGTN
jgi:hypothetical protein